MFLFNYVGTLAKQFQDYLKEHGLGENIRKRKLKRDTREGVRQVGDRPLYAICENQSVRLSFHSFLLP